MNQMRGSTVHWGRLIVGFGNRASPEMNKLLDIEKEMLEDPEKLERLIAFAREQGMDQILFHWNEYPKEIRPILKEKVKANAYLNPIIEKPDFWLFEIDSDQSAGNGVSCLLQSHLFA